MAKSWVSGGVGLIVGVVVASAGITYAIGTTAENSPTTSPSPSNSAPPSSADSSISPSPVPDSSSPADSPSQVPAPTPSVPYITLPDGTRLWVLQMQNGVVTSVSDGTTTNTVSNGFVIPNYAVALHGIPGWIDTNKGWLVTDGSFVYTNSSCSGLPSVYRISETQSLGNKGDSRVGRSDLGKSFVSSIYTNGGNFNGPGWLLTPNLLPADTPMWMQRMGVCTTFEPQNQTWRREHFDQYGPDNYDGWDSFNAAMDEYATLPLAEITYVRLTDISQEQVHF